MGKSLFRLLSAILFVLSLTLITYANHVAVSVAGLQLLLDVKSRLSRRR